MKTLSTLSIVVITVCIILGCKLGGSVKSSLPKEAYPEKIGKYKRDSAADYVSSYRSFKYTALENPSKTIDYSLEIYSDATYAKKKLDENYVCSKQEVQRQSKDTAFGKEVVKEEVLKDKSGNAVGTIVICRQKQVGSSNRLGYYFYFVAYSNNNLLSTFDTSKNYVEKIPSGELFEFIKGIPNNTNLNFESLKPEESTSSKSKELLTAEEFAKFAPPVKIAQKPYLKVKVVVVDDNLFGMPIGGSVLGIDEKIVATMQGEFQSIVQIKCEKGRKIGTYVLKSGVQIPAYQNVCKISIIDYTIPAVIAQKTFINSDLYESETFSEGTTEFVAPMPYEQIEKYFDTLSVTSALAGL